MKYSYFPGCTLYTKAKNFNNSGLASAAALGLELVELPSWTCCGAAFSLVTDNLMALSAPSRILARARKNGERLVTLCSACYNVLKRTNKLLQKDQEKRKKINDFIEENYKGDLEVFHFLEILRDDIGFPKIEAKLKVKLEKLKVAPYYGCLLLRPFDELGLDNPEQPRILGDFLHPLGCEVINFPYQAECCGSYLALSPNGIITELSYSILRSSLRNGAEMVITSCPLCQFNLDRRQKEMAEKYFGFPKIPILYFTQLLGLALGIKIDLLGFDQHYVDPQPLLKHKGLF